MWAFLIEYDAEYGYFHRLGSSSTRKLNSKTPRGWYNELSTMRHSANGMIYILPSFTQEMCEMEPSKFCEYVMKNYIHVMYARK